MCFNEYDVDVPAEKKILLGGDLNSYLKGYDRHEIVVFDDLRE